MLDTGGVGCYAGEGLQTMPVSRWDFSGVMSQCARVSKHGATKFTSGTFKPTPELPTSTGRCSRLRVNLNLEMLSVAKVVVSVWQKIFIYSESDTFIAKVVTIHAQFMNLQQKLYIFYALYFISYNYPSCILEQQVDRMRYLQFTYINITGGEMGEVLKALSCSK